MNYLVIKNSNTSKSYQINSTNNSSPYIRMGGGYIDLTTETVAGLKLKFNINNKTYRPIQVTTTTSSTSEEYTETTGYSGVSTSINNESTNFTKNLDYTAYATYTQAQLVWQLFANGRTGYNTVGAIRSISTSLVSEYSSTISYRSREEHDIIYSNVIQTLNISIKQSLLMKSWHTSITGIYGKFLNTSISRSTGNPVAYSVRYFDSFNNSSLENFLRFALYSSVSGTETNGFALRHWDTYTLDAITNSTRSYVYKGEYNTTSSEIGNLSSTTALTQTSSSSSEYNITTTI